MTSSAAPPATWSCERVRAHYCAGRPAARSRARPLQIGPLTIDTASRAVSLAGKHLELRRQEYELLLFLASDPRAFGAAWLTLTTPVCGLSSSASLTVHYRCPSFTMRQERTTYDREHRHRDAAPGLGGNECRGGPERLGRRSTRRRSGAASRTGRGYARTAR